MSNSSNLNRNSYLTKNVGHFPESLTFNDIHFEKVEDLRYGTNPHQPAAFYRISGKQNPIGDLKTLKSGKNGLSQTNLEDISYALNIIKFFKNPACAVMKHVNPSGVAIAHQNESTETVYLKARDCDPRAAFGSTIALNTEVDEKTAMAIMSTFNECVVAPSFTPEALAVFNDSETYKMNRHLRVLQCGDLSLLPKFSGDNVESAQTVKILADGSLVIAAPLLTSVRSFDDLNPARGENKNGVTVSTCSATEMQKQDLLAAWYINISVRSNGVVIVKNGETLAVGTGEQDRVGAVEQAISKCHEKYKGTQILQDAVMSSDGFFPFPDAVEVAAKAGIRAIVAPSGSLKDSDVVARANELGVALFHAPERVFSHH